MTQQKESKKEFRIIGQGTYGCAYRPSITCTGQKMGSAQFLSKVQIKDKSSEVEYKAGQIIKGIPNYQYYFAPVIEQCPINISTINNDELKKCDVIAKSSKQTTYVSSKIRYIGKEPLDDYFKRVLLSKNTSAVLQKYWKTIANSHLYLLNSVHLLNQAGLLHLDIKENNIMRDPKNDVFIIIDFGLSYEIKNLDRTNYNQTGKTPFGVRVESYVPWCIEINILSHIARVVQPAKGGELQKEKWTEEVKNAAELKELCNLFVKNNTLLQDNVFSKEERADYLQRLHTWVEGMRGKTWGEIWDMVKTSYVSWDAYGVSAMFLKELVITDISTMLNDLPKINRPDPEIQEQAKAAISQIFNGPPPTRYTYFMQEYVKLLKRHILSDPGTRSTPDKLRQEIQGLFKNIEREEYNIMNKHIAPTVLAKKNIENLDKKKAQNTLRELRTDREIMKKYIFA